MTILPSPTAPLGSVAYPHEWRMSDLISTDAIICRNSAPLVNVAFRLIANRVACHILGRDIGANLIKLIKGFRATSREELVQKLDRYEERESRKRESETVEDRCNCLRFIVANCASVDEAIATIEDLFKDRANAITLSTIHKAKGLEWETVYLLDRLKLMPSRFAKLDWQKEQEKNLLYVAVTRAKVNLIHVNSNELKS